MTEKDLEIQQLRRELDYTEGMYKAQRTLNEHLMSISELLAAENAKLKAEIGKSGRMNDYERFYELRRRVFGEIDRIRAEGESGKSYEGLFEICFDFEECYGVESMKDEPKGVEIKLHCYLLGTHRHYSWRGENFVEALDYAETQIDKWIR